MEHVRERVHVSQAFKDRPNPEGVISVPLKMEHVRERVHVSHQNGGGNFSPAKNGTRSRTCSCFSRIQGSFPNPWDWDRVSQAFKGLSQTPGIGMRPLSNIFPGKIEEEKKE
jgi:hypothetical protein